MSWLTTTSAALAESDASRVYVEAYTCMVDEHGYPLANPGTPEVTLRDQNPDGSTRSISKPPVHIVLKSPGVVQFYFDTAPGNYDALVDLLGKGSCGSNGPLVVIPGASRHLFVMTGKGVMDWHARLALAGVLPDPAMTVRAVVLDRPAKCGDDPRDYTVRESDGVVDDGVYYANLMAYDRQDHTVALIISGALFTERAILLTQPLGGPKHSHDLVLKNLFYDTVWIVVGATPPNRFACIPKF